MSTPEDNRTLWVGNLETNVTEELVYELFLQAGPIDRLVFPTEYGGEGNKEKKNKGHAYVVFKHPDSVQYSTQVMDGTTLFSQLLSLKARSLPVTYKKESLVPSNVPSIMSTNKGRFDNSSLRGGFNRGPRWQQQDNFSPQAKGNFRGRGVNNYDQGNFNTFNNYNNQVTTGGWLQQGSSSTNDNLQDKRQRLLQQQNVLIDAHRQMQPQPQQIMNQQMYAQQQFPIQQQQQQWVNNAYNWNMASYQQTYQTDQYGQYFPQQ